MTCVVEESVSETASVKRDLLVSKESVSETARCARGVGFSLGNTLGR